MAQKKNIKDTIYRYIHDLYTKEDVETLSDQTTHISSLTEISDQMDKIWEEAQFAETPISKQTEYQQEAQRLLLTLEKHPKRINIKRFLRYAALIALVSISAWGIYISQTSTENIIYTEIKVDNGKHQEIELPDGTKVILNAGSFIKYPQKFSAYARNIEIDGEAFFDVTKDEEKPFIVHTDKVNIKVLGTSFNVKSYNTDEQTTISVKTGKVQVDMDEAMTRLTANEQLILDKRTGEFQKRNENVKHATSWINGGLYFNKTHIFNVVQELERMYNCKIIFQEGNIYDDYIYGEHDNKSLESVLNSIQHSTNIKYKKEGNKIILYK